MASKRKREERKYTKTKSLLENFDSGGFSPTCFNMPSGMKMYKWKKGRNKLDFMPFVVGKNNPNAEEGFVHWERTYFTHEIPTADGNRKYPCLAKNFGKKCPICARLTKMKLKGEGNPEAIKKMDVKTRRAFLVIDRNDKEAGIQLLETGHFKSFGELIQHTLMSLDDDSVFLDFYHLSDGASLSVTGVDDSYLGRNYIKPTVITFEPRKTQYKEDMLDDIPCLDDMLKEYKLEELIKIYDQSENDEEEEDDEDEDTNKKKKKSKKKDEDEDDEDDSDDEDGDSDDDGDEDDDTPKKKGRGKKKDEDEDDDSDDSDDDEEDEDDDSDDDEEDEDEDDNPKKRGKKYVPKVGEEVTFKHKKKMVTGEVVKVNKANEMALVKIEEEKRPIGVTFDQLSPVEEADDSDDDDGDEETDKKKPTKKMGKNKNDDDEDDFQFDDDDDEEEEEEEEEDEDERKSRPRR